MPPSRRNSFTVTRLPFWRKEGAGAPIAGTIQTGEPSSARLASRERRKARSSVLWQSPLKPQRTMKGTTGAESNKMARATWAPQWSSTGMGRVSSTKHLKAQCMEPTPPTSPWTRKVTTRELALGERPLSLQGSLQGETRDVIV
jgi:hypothetical protein